MDNKNCHSIGTVSIVPVIKGTDPRDACQCQSICGGFAGELMPDFGSHNYRHQGRACGCSHSACNCLSQGFTPVPVLVVPIALGNLVLVIVVALLHKRSNLLAFAAGAVLKFFALYLGVVKIVVPFFLPANAPEQMKTVLSVQFSWPQLITAAIGGILALIILPVLKKAIEDL